MIGRTLELQVELGRDDDETFEFRVTPECVAEVTEDLRTGGFEPDEAIEHSADTRLTLFLVSFAKAGGIEALARILSIVLARHDKKRFVLRTPDGSEIQADGYSASEIRRLLDSARKGT